MFKIRESVLLTSACICTSLNCPENAVLIIKIGKVHLYILKKSNSSLFSHHPSVKVLTRNTRRFHATVSYILMLPNGDFGCVNIVTLYKRLTLYKFLLF
jgi:hypothetical protein